MAKFNSNFMVEESINTKSKHKYCSSCGTENNLDSKFCFECGNTKFYDTKEEYNDVKNTKYCLKCKAKLEAKMKFCPYCGSNEFVKNIESLEEEQIKAIENKWKVKINEANAKLNETLALIEKYKKDNTNLLKEYEKLEKYYIKEYEDLKATINNYSNSISQNLKAFEKEYNELREKKNELTIKINDLKKVK